MNMASTQPTSQSAEPVVGISRDDARRRANFYLLMVMGDALYVSGMDISISEGKRVWRATVLHRATRERVGELHLDAETGEEMTWYPDATGESNDHRDGA
jgi:hypothetical protein